MGQRAGLSFGPWFGLWVSLLFGLWLAPAGAASAAEADGADGVCGAGAPRLVALGGGLWWVPAAQGDASAANRGQVSNLMVVQQGTALWLLGSGPSPAFGRALACVLRRDLGRWATDVLSPWARPELVLGLAGLQAAARRGGGPAPRHWAHADVAAAMAARCPRCVERLRQRLGKAAADLGQADPVRVPRRLLQGDSGRLGPWRWWRLHRSDTEVVTLWRLADRPLWVSPGLLNGDGPGDARDASLARLAESVARLQALADADGPAARHLGEQGPWQGADLPAAHRAYWAALGQQVRAAMDRGTPETDAAPAWPGLPEAWARHPWHALNWQHAWRDTEPDWLLGPRR